jgi:hypothetical protein
MFELILNKRLIMNGIPTSKVRIAKHEIKKSGLMFLDPIKHTQLTPYKNMQ